MILHEAAMPYCYLDTESRKIVIKLAAPKNTKSISIVYGDPFEYKKTDDKNELGDHVWTWKFQEQKLHKQFYGGSHEMWKTELSIPPRRRLKYGFVIGQASGKTIYFSENGAEDYDSSVVSKPHNHFYFPFIHEVDAIRLPKWAENVCWYQIFPDRFFNGDTSINPPDCEKWEDGVPKLRNFFGGDIRGIIMKLPYLLELGITGIYLTPVFKSPSNHKYDTSDYLLIDKHFGSLEDFKELVARAHKIGIKVMMDAVFNHAGSKHPFWQDVLKNQEKSVYKDYFHIKSFPVKEEYAHRDELNFDTFAFTPRMPKWNTENPAARKYLIDAALFWVNECDIDAWRLDVSDEVSFSFWREFRAELKKAKPEIYILGELWHNPSKWLSGGYFDAVMNYPLGRVIRDFFLTKELPAEVFCENLMKNLFKHSDIHSKIQFNLLDSHDTARALTLAGGCKKSLKNAFIFMLFMKGAPCIYYGTEVGMDGRGDPDCRKPMVWNEKKQDRELFGFFINLLKLRREYEKLIQNASIEYKHSGNMHYWHLSYNSKGLTIAYNDGNANKKIDGKILIGTSSMEKHVPPKSVVVYV